MNKRILARSLIVATAGLAVCSLPGFAAAQEAKASKAAFSYQDGSPEPVTPWGAPDLQGMWPITNLIATPLQRNPKYGDRRYLNDEEWKKAEGVLKRRYERYAKENSENKLGMGSWAESTMHSEAARLTSLISYPPNGRIPPLTPRGEELAKNFHSDDTGKVFNSPADFDAWDRCITRGLPSSMLPYNYDNGIQIVQAPGYVIIRLEMIHESRIIPIDGAPIDPGVRQWMGVSRGHWEGSALVVETSHFNGKVAMLITGIPGGYRGNLPTSTSLKITERFTRVSHDRIDYQMTVEDPVVLTDKWTVSYPMFLDPTYKMYEYACQEGNTAVRDYIATSLYERGLISAEKAREATQ
ncbi:MAG TPA: hypothetical protein VFY39_14710 [Gammaproteobacteria bacterium]|nr:hypothetical protein [Gammaproteobacteria bacterium]